MTVEHIQIEEGQYPEIQPNMFGLDSYSDDEYSRMAAHAEELHGLNEVDAEDL